MPDCQDCYIFKEWSGVKEAVKENTGHRRKLTAPDGTLDRIWAAIEKRASKPLMITILVGTFTLMIGLFGLVYQSNEKILTSFSKFESHIAVIRQHLKLDNK